MKTLIALAAIAASFSAVPALAQEVARPAQIVVSYSDLDLGTRAGVQTLDRRIRSAVELACGPTSPADPAGKNVVVRCHAETLALARARRDTAIAAATVPSPVQLASRR
jgi:UrcA family protein